MAKKKEMTPEKLEMMKNLPDTHERETLRPWHTLAVVKVFLGQTHEEVAKDLRKGKHTIAKLMCSPAAKRLVAYLEEKLGDPADLAIQVAKAQALNVTTDWYTALEWAKAAGDYDAVAKMSKDLAALGGVQAKAPKQEVEETRTVRIVLDTDTLDAPVVDADWETVEDEEEDDDEGL